MFGRVYAVAINTFREAVRDRVLYGVLGCATFVLLFSLALGELSLEHEERVVMDIGMASISIFSVVVAVFLGSSLLYKEIERRTLYVILPKPIQRWEFLVGKYLGIVLTAWVFIMMMGSVQLIVAATQGEASWALVLSTPVVLLAILGVALWKAKDRAFVLVPWSVGALVVTSGIAQFSGVNLGVALATLELIAVEVAVVAAIAMLFSSFSTPFLTGLLTLGVWILGQQVDEMETITEAAVGSELKGLLTAMSHVLPNCNLFYPGRNTLTTADELGGPWEFVLNTSAYGFFYAALTVILAALVFRRRDFL